MARRLSALVLAGALALGGTACRDDGRVLAEPTRAPTSSTADPASTSSSAPALSAALSITSPAFQNGAELPAAFTCDEADISPALEWTGVPPSAQELAIVVDDADAEGFVHWVIAGLSPFDGSVVAGITPQGAAEANNDFGALGWGGPCPPEGETHSYTFTIYVLPEPLGLAPGLEAHEAVNLITTAAVDSASIVGLYTRPAPG